MLTLRFTTDNAAFCDDDDTPVGNDFAKQIACARILESVAKRIRGGRMCGLIHDHNGNTIGKFTVD